MAGGGGDTDAVTDALGVVAGVLLAICLLPQLWKMYRSKSAQDIAYGWTFFYFAGLMFYFAYLFRMNALVGWIGILVEAFLVVLVVAGKFYLEHYYQPRRQAAVAGPSDKGDADLEEAEDGRAPEAGGGQGGVSPPPPIELLGLQQQVTSSVSDDSTALHSADKPPGGVSRLVSNTHDDRHKHHGSLLHRTSL